MGKLNLKGLGALPRENEDELIKIDKPIEEPPMIIAQPPVKKPAFAIDLSKAQKHEENRQDPTSEVPSLQIPPKQDEAKAKSPIPSLKIGAVTEQQQQSQ